MGRSAKSRAAFPRRKAGSGIPRCRSSAFEDVRETAFRPGHYALDSTPLLPGHVLINDGTRHAIYYGIGEDTGLLGITWGVEWCVVGLDRNWAYNPACKAARP